VEQRHTRSASFSLFPSPFRFSWLGILVPVAAATRRLACYDHRDFCWPSSLAVNASRIVLFPFLSEMPGHGYSRPGRGVSAGIPSKSMWLDARNHMSGAPTTSKAIRVTVRWRASFESKRLPYNPPCESLSRAEIRPFKIHCAVTFRTLRQAHEGINLTWYVRHMAILHEPLDSSTHALFLVGVILSARGDECHFWGFFSVHRTSHQYVILTQSTY
jgi:hypothetical protein